MGLMVADDYGRPHKILAMRIGFGISHSWYPVVFQNERGHEVQDAVEIILLLLRYLPDAHIDKYERRHYEHCRRDEEDYGICSPEESK